MTRGTCGAGPAARGRPGAGLVEAGVAAIFMRYRLRTARHVARLSDAATEGPECLATALCGEGGPDLGQRERETASRWRRGGTVLCRGLRMAGLLGTCDDARHPMRRAC